MKLSGYIRFWSSFRFSSDKMQDVESELLHDLNPGTCIEDVYMNLEYESGQRLLEERFIERNLCRINITVGEIIGSVLPWN